MNRMFPLGVAALMVAGCGPSFDERHLDGLDLAGATIAEFRAKYGPEDERTPLYVMGLPVYHRLLFKLLPEDASRITTAPSGKLFVDEGSSHNAIRVWLPLPKAPRSYEDALGRWDKPKRKTIIQPSAGGSLPLNLIGMRYAEFEVNEMEVGLFYDGESDRVAVMTWAPLFKAEDESAKKKDEDH
ncbi:MAG TPA: hypothetical protein V6D00_04170 [Pantanalinema sp.]